jgi:hypothetical protein
MPLGRNRQASLLTRFTAVAGLLLVLTLTVLAASPELHERLHGHDLGTPRSASHAAAPKGAADTDDDGCVVTLFAQGVIMALALFALAFSGQRLRIGDVPAYERVQPEAPSYLFLPTQAPPAPVG